MALMMSRKKSSGGAIVKTTKTANTVRTGGRWGATISLADIDYTLITGVTISYTGQVGSAAYYAPVDENGALQGGGTGALSWGVTLGTDSIIIDCGDGGVTTDGTTGTYTANIFTI